MQRKRLDILLPLDRNAVPGAALAPARLRNLVGSRRGGYTVHGRVVAGVDGGVDATAPGRLLGADARGGAGFLAAGGYRLARSGQTGFVYASGTGSGLVKPWDGVFVPEVGVYSAPVSFLVENQEGTLMARPGTDFGTLSVTLSPRHTGGELPFGGVQVLAVASVPTKRGALVLALAHAATEVWSHRGRVEMDVSVTGDLQGVLLDGGEDEDTARVPVDVDLYASWGIEHYHLDATAAMPLTYLGRLEPDLDGLLQWTLDRPVTGASIGSFGRFALPVLRSPSAVHDGRVWARPNSGQAAAGRAGMTQRELWTDPNTLLYSDKGFVNLFGPENWMRFEPDTGGEVQALVSTPAGLLVFFDNEAMLVTGQGPYHQRAFLAGIGCDPGVLPAQLGGNLFTLWQGQLYGIRGGTAEPVGRPVWVPAERLTQVAADHGRRHLLVANEKGRVFRYETETGFWSDSPADAIELEAQGVLPAPGTADPSAAVLLLPDARGDGPRVMKAFAGEVTAPSVVGTEAADVVSYENKHFQPSVVGEAGLEDLLDIDVFEDPDSVLCAFSASDTPGLAVKDTQDVRYWPEMRAAPTERGLFQDDSTLRPSYLADLADGFPGFLALGRGAGNTPERFVMPNKLAHEFVNVDNDAILVMAAGVGAPGTVLSAKLASEGNDALRVELALDSGQLKLQVTVRQADNLGDYVMKPLSWGEAERSWAFALIIDEERTTPGNLVTYATKNFASETTVTQAGGKLTYAGSHAGPFTGLVCSGPASVPGELGLHFLGAWQFPAGTATDDYLLKPTSKAARLLEALRGRVGLG